MNKYSFFDILNMIQAKYGRSVLPDVGESLPYRERMYAISYDERNKYANPDTAELLASPDKSMVMAFLHHYGFPDLDQDPYTLLYGINGRDIVPVAVYESEPFYHPMVLRSKFRYVNLATTEEAQVKLLNKIVGSGNCALVVPGHKAAGITLHQATYSSEYVYSPTLQ